MKLVCLVFNTILVSHIMKHFEKCGITEYTQWSGVTGIGTTGPHLGTHVWPGTNTIIFVVVQDDAQKNSLLHCVREVRRNHPEEGIKAFVMPVEEMV